MQETARRTGWRRKGGMAIAGLLLLGLIGAAAQRGTDQDTSSRSMMMDSALVAPATAGPPDGSATVSGAAMATRAGGSAGRDAIGANDTVTEGSSASKASGTPLPNGLGEPKVVKTATLGVEVKKGAFGDAFSRAASIAATNGGFVSSSTSRLGSGMLVVRVPAEKFDETRRQLAGLGKVTEEQIQGVDMSGSLADLEARLRNLSAQEQAIRLIMDKAKTIGETIQVQDQLTQVREQIERLTAEQARLNDSVALSTLTVSVSEPGAAVDNGDERSPLADSFAKAVDGAQLVVGGLIVSLGYLLPLAVVAWMVWLVLSVRSRRSQRFVNAEAGISA